MKGEILTLYTATVVLVRLTLVDKEPFVQVLGTQLKRFLNILRTADRAALLLLVEVLKVKRLHLNLFKTFERLLFVL